MGQWLGKQAAVPQGVVAEKTYTVIGSEVHTPYSLRLEIEVRGESVEFRGDASGRFFHSGAQPLQHAKLRTRNLQALVSRGTLFRFTAFGPAQFEVLFLDPKTTGKAPPLGVLQADPLAPLDQSSPCLGCGSGAWSTVF